MAAGRIWSKKIFAGRSSSLSKIFPTINSPNHFAGRIRVGCGGSISLYQAGLDQICSCLIHVVHDCVSEMNLSNPGHVSRIEKHSLSGGCFPSVYVSDNSHISNIRQPAIIYIKVHISVSSKCCIYSMFTLCSV